jgi:hypothetical protein
MALTSTFWWTVILNNNLTNKKTGRYAQTLKERIFFYIVMDETRHEKNLFIPSKTVHTKRGGMV